MFAHFRPLFVAFLSLALGIYVAELFREGKTIYTYIIVAVIAILIVLSLFHFSSKSKFFDYLWKNIKVIVVFAVFVVIGFSSFTITKFNIESQQNIRVNSSITYNIVGELRFSPIKYENRMTMFLYEVTLISASESIELESSGMYVVVNTTEINENSKLFSARAGDVVLLNGKVKNSDVFSKNDVFAYAYKSNFRYTAYVESDCLKIIDGTQSGIDRVRQYLKDIFYSSMDARYAGLAYALFIGDVSGIDYDMQLNFKYSGIAHLLAVSGLNTALLAMVLMWIFKRCKIKPKYGVLFVALFLAFYCVLCDFAPSVMRASLMSVFLLLGQAFGKQSDNISSVSLAGIILLLLSPMFLFDLSFLLSFASVFGIFFFYPIFEKLFLKLKMGKFVSSNLALSLAAQIATLPLMINTFGYVSVVSLLANLLVVPFMGWLFIAMFVSLIIIMILPFMWWMLWLCQWGLWLCDVLSAWFASWPFSIVQTNVIATFVLFFLFFAMFCFSRFCVIKNKKPKLALWGALACTGVLLLTLNYTVFPLL